MVGSQQRYRVLSVYCAIVLAAIVSADVLAGQEVDQIITADAPADPIEAVWKQQEISFYFHSFTTFYPCASLTKKVRRMLLELGANPNLQVRSVGCMADSGMARTSLVHIHLAAPVPATPEAIAEIDKTRSTRELIARVRGEMKEAAAAAMVFPAQWKRVAFSRGQMDLQGGDCELVDEFKRKVMPKLSVRVLKDESYCSPHQPGMGLPILEVEALAALPSADAVEKTAIRPEGPGASP